MNQIETYRCGVVYFKNMKYHAVLIDIAKNKNNAILGINNTKAMTSMGHDSAKLALEFIAKSQIEVDYLISDIMGLTDDYVYISNGITQKEKSRVFGNYASAFNKIQKGMFSKPSRPIAGQIFEQNMTTSEYTFLFETLNLDTFAVMFSVNQVLNNRSRSMIEEIHSIF